MGFVSMGVASLSIQKKMIRIAYMQNHIRSDDSVRMWFFTCLFV